MNEFGYDQHVSFWLFSLVYVAFNLGAMVALRAAVILLTEERLKQIKDAPAIQNMFWGVVIIGGIYMGLYLMFDIAITVVRQTVFLNDTVIPWQYVLFDAISYAVPFMCIGYHAYFAYTCAEILFPDDDESVILSRRPNVCCTNVCCTKNNSRCVAVWIPLSWAQLLATSFIPVLVSTLTDTIRTIAILMLVFSVAVCLVLCLALAFKILYDRKANIRYMYVGEQKNVRREKLMTLGMLFTSGAVICVVLAVCILALTDEGGNTFTGSATTYVYTLLPTVLFSAISIGIKRFFFSEESGTGLECFVHEDEKEKTGLESVEGFVYEKEK